jgi:1,4-dihydroxy-2-naphthoate octaprenyltransferase
MSQLKYWVLASRPKTLVAALVPVYLASLLSFLLTDYVNIQFTLLAALCTVLVQISTNFFNDAIDFKKGTDTEDRLGPTRMVQAGHLSARSVLWAGVLLCVVAFFLSLPIVKSFGVIVLVIGAASFLFSYGYTGGPYPLAYNALGELFVYLFFGVIAVMGTFYIQKGLVAGEAFVLGSQVGFYACVLISINNLRDRRQDLVAQKKTLVVLLGELRSKQLVYMLIFLPQVFGMYWLFQGYRYLFWGPLLLIPFSVGLARSIARTEPSRQYNQFLAKSALQMILFSLLFSISVCLEKY